LVIQCELTGKYILLNHVHFREYKFRFYSGRTLNVESK